MENNTIHTKQNRNVPELRFPGFEGEWDKSTLGNSTKWKSGGTPSKENSDYWNGNIPWISAASMVGKYYSKSERTLTKQGLEAGSRISPKGSLLLLVRGSMLYNKIPVGIVTIDLAFNQDVKSLIPIDNVNNEFLFEWFNFSQNRLLNLVVGTGIGAGKLDTDVLKKQTIFIPSLPEQTRIATFLSAIDKRINLLQQKKTGLEQYKKGVMQKLFSVDTDGRPALRFKNDDSSDYPTWEEKRLGDLYSFKTTNSYSRDKLNYDNGYIKNIHYGDIHTKFKSHFDINEESVPYINSNVDTSKITEECFVQEGDLVIVDASEDYADIGKAIEIININNEKLVAGLHTFLGRRKKQNIAIGFVEHIMRSFYVRLELMRIAQGTKVLSLSTKRLSEIIIHLPSLPEQQKIANFLSSIDKSIEKVGSQIDESIIYKKGLLQKMFC